MTAPSRPNAADALEQPTDFSVAWCGDKASALSRWRRPSEPSVDALDAPRDMRHEHHEGM